MLPLHSFSRRRPNAIQFESGREQSVFHEAVAGMLRAEAALPTLAEPARDALLQMKRLTDEQAPSRVIMLPNASWFQLFQSVLAERAATMRATRAKMATAMSALMGEAFVVAATDELSRQIASGLMDQAAVVPELIASLPEQSSPIGRANGRHLDSAQAT